MTLFRISPDSGIMLQRAKEAWYDADAKTWKEGKKYLQVSTDEVYGALGAEGFFMETTPLCPHSPYSSSKASADMFVMAFHDTYGMPINITRCSNNYGPYQFPEADPAAHQQRQAAQDAARLRRRYADPRLAVR